jgi:lysozyme family protein
MEEMTMEQRDPGPAPDETIVKDDVDGHSDGISPVETGEAVIEEALRPWRAAEALKALRAQVDAAFPRRKKGNDGTVGDAAHQSRKSDHNPWIVDGANNVVSAIDITHDPASGCDCSLLVEALRAGRDRRIKYLIWNRRIANAAAIGSVPAWTWRAYTGANPHDHHFHLSVKPDKALYDDRSPWTITALDEALVETPDTDADIAAALATLGAQVDPSAPLLPQLVECQEALTQLMAIYAQSEALAEGAEEAVAPDFSKLKPDYERLFASATIPAARKAVVAWHVSMLRKGKSRYQAVEAITRAPWWFVGIVHAMEASFSFTGHLHNGDPLGTQTVQVPKGRPKPWNPPSDWVSSAVDAITVEGHANQADWSLARTLFRFEAYNGFGYHGRGINSPYLWSFSNHYSKGKFVKDGKFDPNAVSKQCGAAVMLRALIDAGEASVPS